MTEWLKLGEINGGEYSEDHFGDSVSISSDGSIVAIGAPNNDANGDNSGHVRVYKYDQNSGNWSQLGNDMDGEASEDQASKISLSSDGKILL